MSEPVTPALTPEEVHGRGIWTDPDSGRAGRPEVWLDGDDFCADNSGYEYTEVRISRRKAAALALLGEFTWADVDLLRRAAPTQSYGSYITTDGETGMFALADRIAALLPPRP